ncbi:dephospho-CoA kinase [Dongia soli]|uniref:Dephospho-CoA kinase n=1 Tax=Dongia soli TaxID=600628 RepID=A0ABU5E6S2_9PROT|nr:dephospho-CoA kinase [Dongia soli]MDY0881985.1 dephospho-CoA kinase [Dongia soli]
MIVLGLTGSIGMGKSTAAAMLRRIGIPVHDADAAVHRLMAKGGAAVPAIEAAFPGVVRDGAVDRKALGAKVFGHPQELQRLEKILHPMVQAVARRFVQHARAQRRRMVVLDIPLLYETGGEKRCDAVIVVTAPRFLQRARVLARPNMTPERLTQIEKLQMPDAEKRRRADILINTGLGRRTAFRALRRALSELPGRQKKAQQKRRAS